MAVLMKKAICLLVLFFFLVITGCSYAWKHDYKPRSALRKDLEECQKSVRTFRREYTGKEDPYNEQIMINECMESKGWHR